MDHSIGWKPRFHDITVASYRLRCLNPLRQLRARGLPVELFRTDHLKMYRGVVYSKLYDRKTYEEAVALKRRGVRIAFDLCDNHFHSAHDSEFWRSVEDDLRRMLRVADEVVASSEALADEIRRQVEGTRKITVIGDGVESEIDVSTVSRWKQAWYRFRTARLVRQIQSQKTTGRIPIVWFGYHGSSRAEGGMLDLLKVRSLLESISPRFPIRLTVISNSKHKFLEHIRPWSIPTVFVQWDPISFLPILRSHYIAVLPIARNPFTRCKTNNRLALALNCGLAVVADSIPSFLAFSEACFLDNWEAGLEAYLGNQNLRRDHVLAGQSIIAKSWTTEKIADRWQALLNRLVA